MLTILCFVLSAPVQENYTRAYWKAREEKKMLLVNLGSSVDLSKINPGDDHILVNLSLNTEYNPNKKLKDDPIINQHLEGGSGVFVIDFKHPERNNGVVSALPARHCSWEKVQVLTELPNGTLTQRTLIWAIKIHPEKPQSTCGFANKRHLLHCEGHSLFQARSRYQHHACNWHHVGQKEIVAESWDWSHNVADAAIDIINSWRQAPGGGHWRAIQRDWQNYGYDMKHSGEKWYATGIFGD